MTCPLRFLWLTITVLIACWYFFDPKPARTVEHIAVMHCEKTCDASGCTTECRVPR